jgi:hypothetical protein
MVGKEAAHRLTVTSQAPSSGPPGRIQSVRLARVRQDDVSAGPPIATTRAGGSPAYLGRQVGVRDAVTIRMRSPGRRPPAIDREGRYA